MDPRDYDAGARYHATCIPPEETPAADAGEGEG
jgi:hypothetical protein